jgi:hypothetical protein
MSFSPGTLGGSLGTAFGAKIEHSVSRVEFDARPAPSAVIRIRYEDAAILRAFGIEIEDFVTPLHSPDAFPADGYCPPPRNWRG